MDIEEVIEHIETFEYIHSSTTSAESKIATKLLREAYKEGFVTDDCKVRKVSGILPITKDDVIAMPGTVVFHPKQDPRYELEVMVTPVELILDLGHPVGQDCEYVGHYVYQENGVGEFLHAFFDIKDCYFSQEASEKAKFKG